MARHPASDERAVARVQCKSSGKERFYLAELARFLRASAGDVSALLARRRVLWKVSKGPARKSVYWTTAYGVALAVVHFRAYQAEVAQFGAKRVPVKGRP